MGCSYRWLLWLHLWYQVVFRIPVPGRILPMIWTRQSWLLRTRIGSLWTRQDTIAALRKMHETTHKPIIYQASDVNFRNAALKEDAYFILALVDKRTAAPKIKGHKIASDSIMLIPENNIGGVAVQLQGFADCSMASVFAASDQTLPGVFFSLSLLSIVSMYIWRRKETEPITEACRGSAFYSITYRNQTDTHAKAVGTDASWRSRYESG